MSVHGLHLLEDTDILSSFSVLLALLLEGVLYSDIKKGTYDGNKFVQFFEELTDVMNPYPGKHSVLVMDNCQIHHVPEVEEAVPKSRCVQFIETVLIMEL